MPSIPWPRLVLAALAPLVLAGCATDWSGWSSETIKNSRMVNGIKKLAGFDLNEPLARQQFQQAEELFVAKKYDEAEKLYKKAGRHWPDSPLEEDALFMQAECKFFTDRYPSASDTYGRLLTKYENSRHLDTVVHRQFAIARYWIDLQHARPKYLISPNLTDRTRPLFDTPGNALANYEAVRLHDPTGPLADDSLMATANYHFIDERYEDADHYYTLLRNDYPKSEHLKQAYLLGLRAKLRKYAGPQYDGTPLVEAEKLVDQMLLQFAEELGEERARVVQAGQAIRAQLAERDWQMAEFYNRTGHYRAAGMYYQKVVREFADTQFAQMANERLVAIQDKPPEPAERFAWLENLLGPSKRQR